jgi:hypothetical protein
MSIRPDRFSLLMTLLETAQCYMHTAAITKSPDNRTRLIKRADGLIRAVALFTYKPSSLAVDEERTVQRELRRAAEELDSVRCMSLQLSASG